MTLLLIDACLAAVGLFLMARAARRRQRAASHKPDYDLIRKLEASELDLYPPMPTEDPASRWDAAVWPSEQDEAFTVAALDARRIQADETRKLVDTLQKHGVRFDEVRSWGDAEPTRIDYDERELQIAIEARQKEALDIMDELYDTEEES
jgi:hypothetical protein